MPIYIGTQKINMSGMDKVYVGTTLVYQKNAPLVTISYRKAIYQSTVPSSIQVPVGYTLTSADIPTQTDSSTWSVTGWTLDGTTAVTAGYVVTGDITLLAIHKATVTSGNLYKTSKKASDGYISQSKTVETSISLGNVGNSDSGSTTFTYALSGSVSRTFTTSDSNYYHGVMIGGWGGVVYTGYIDKACRLEWTPSNYQATFTLPSGVTGINNYQGTYPTVVLRHNDTGAYIWSTTQNNTNKISYQMGNPHSGSTIRMYIQFGGNNGGKKLAQRTGYWSRSSSMSSNMTCNRSTTTETLYLYTL